MLCLASGWDNQRAPGSGTEVVFREGVLRGSGPPKPHKGLFGERMGAAFAQQVFPSEVQTLPSWLHNSGHLTRPDPV